jgi:hypothetical protein
MKIHWNQNPFKTKIEIDSRDLELLLRRHQSEEYADILCELDLRLQGKIGGEALTDPKNILEKISSWSAIYDLSIDSKEIQNYVEWLDDEHCGDCVCLPCSCVRCEVEDMLGVNTLEGLGKHEALKVLRAFEKVETIDEAINSLERLLEQPFTSNKPDLWKMFSQKEYEKHIARWKAETVNALKWLKIYKIKHEF